MEQEVLDESLRNNIQDARILVTQNMLISTLLVYASSSSKANKMTPITLAAKVVVSAIRHFNNGCP